MTATPALSEVFAAQTRLRVDPVLGAHGFSRIESGPWHHVGYARQGRHIVLEMRLDPRDGPRLLMVRLGMGMPSGLGMAATGVTLGRLGGRDCYPVRRVDDVAATLDQITGDLESHAGDFLRDRGLPAIPSQLPVIHR
jgi:hypothetical protein